MIRNFRTFNEIFLIFLILYSSVSSISVSKMKSSPTFSNDSNGVHDIRYVELVASKSNNKAINISQLVVRNENGDNIAKGKPVTASSVLQGTRPETAVDGIESPRSYPNIFHSNNDSNDKFTVDLLENSFVKSVEIFNRSDCCSDRIVGATINLLNSERKVVKEITVTEDKPHIIVNIPNSQANTNNLANNLAKTKIIKRVVRKVIISRNVRYVELVAGKSDNKAINISQFVVRDEKGENIAKGKPVTASSDYPGSKPETAVDGNESPRSFPNIFHSNNNSNDKFTVDLQKNSIVKSVEIFNRADCCSDRIVGATINLLNADKKVLKEVTVTEDKHHLIIHF